MGYNASIWRDGECPSDKAGIIERLDLVDWTEPGSSTAGRMFGGNTWLTNQAAHALSKFALVLAEELQFQAAEIFLAPPREPDDLPSPPQLVAGAYRGRDTKVYSLTGAAPPIKNLMETELAGEQAGSLLSRINGFPDLNPTDPVRRYVQQSIATLCVIALANLQGSSGRGSPEDIRALPALVWKTVQSNNWLPELRVGARGSRGWPTERVRQALRLLVWSNPYFPLGGLLLEEGAQDQQAEVIENARKELEAKALAKIDFENAFAIWSTLSRGVGKLGDALAKDLSEVRARIIIDLFRARIHTYSRFISSVTTSVERQRKPVLIGDLRQRMEETSTWRNQFVNVLALEAYETAGKNLLIKERLQSLLLVPFFSTLKAGQAGVVGFVRLMNRYERDPEVYGGKDLQLHQYRGRWSESIGLTDWSLDDEESAFASALGSILRNRLIDESDQLRPCSDLFVVDWERSRTLKLVSEEGALGIWGRSDHIKDVRLDVREASSNHRPVLLLGPPGTGKTHIAKCIHELSDRRRGYEEAPVTDLPENLLEGILFGWVEGSFTDAKYSKEGLFLVADGGTLLLDEIGGLPLHLQAKLLRAVQQRTVKPVGGDKDRDFDTRLIFATNEDLEELVRQGAFRRDRF